MLSIGVAAALLIAGTWWIIDDYLQPTGWFAYAPGTSTDTYVIVKRREPAHLAIGLGADVIWVAFSLLLFGGRSRKVTP